MFSAIRGTEAGTVWRSWSDAGYEAVNIEGGYRAYLRLSLSRFMENDAKEQKELKTKEIEHSIIKTFRKTVWRPFTKALNQYQLIQEGDKIAVCISGGKDSMLMAKLLQELKRHGEDLILNWCFW